MQIADYAYYTNYAYYTDYAEYAQYAKCARDEMPQRNHFFTGWLPLRVREAKNEKGLF